MKGIAYEVSIDASTYTSSPPMPDRLIERTLRAFSDDLSADTPVPGGGSAAAYAGAMGSGLAAMVARLALKKTESEELRNFVEEMDNLRADFLRLVDDDSAAYARVAEALKLPRKTDEEKKARQERLQGALLGASRVPLEVAKTARRLLEACERGVQSASPMTASDIGVGALMAEAALRGAALNVIINLASVKDPAQVKVLSEDLDRALDGSDDQRKRITDFVESRIAR
jgi:glutamate formiminotransferase/formiminotetrahydrofolate cyclodeaminase